LSDQTIRAVSADSHVNPPTEMWAEYLAPEFRDRAPVLERTDDGDFEVFEGTRRPLFALSNTAGRRPEEYTASVRRLEELRPGAWSPADRLDDQDVDGVDAEILFGTAVGAPLQSSDAALTRAGYTAYNRWLADFCAHAPDRLVGMAYVPSDDPEDAVAEVRDAAGRGLRGAVLEHQPATGEWASDEWTSLWEVLVELDWPAHLHVGPRSATSWGRAAFINGLVSSKLTMPLSLGGLVLNGVLAAHSGLKVVSVEGQIGWIPFWKYYIDHAYEKHRWHQDVHLPELPSTYIERQIWFTFMEDPPGIDERHACGIDRIMWSSDYPHSETTWPHSQKIIGDIFERVPEDEVRKIVRDNCVSLYGLA
jgi:predicted TIM-barrel fold metal-dependent hydrolase